MIDKIILVFYADVTDVPPNEINEHMEKVINMNNVENNNIIQFYVPIMGQTKIECIYPYFIDGEEIKEKFNSLLEKLTQKLEEKI